MRNAFSYSIQNPSHFQSSKFSINVPIVTIYYSFKEVIETLLLSSNLMALRFHNIVSKMETAYQQLNSQRRRACIQVNQQQQCKRLWDRPVCERTNNYVYTVHKQQFSRERVLEKARTQIFYLNNELRLFV